MQWLPLRTERGTRPKAQVPEGFGLTLDGRVNRSSEGEDVLVTIMHGARGHEQMRGNLLVGGCSRSPAGRPHLVHALMLLRLRPLVTSKPRHLVAHAHYRAV